MRSKSLLVLSVVVLAITILATATQPWITVQLSEGAASQTALAITGQDVNAALSPIALACLAGALATTIAGRVFRVVLGVLILLLGAGAAWISAFVFTNTVDAYTARVAEVSGITGNGQAALVESVTVSALVMVTLVAAGLLAITGLGILVLGGRWKNAGRRYAARDAASDGDPTDHDVTADRFDDWDRMSDGEDPSETGATGPRT